MSHKKPSKEASRHKVFTGRRCDSWPTPVELVVQWTPGVPRVRHAMTEGVLQGLVSSTKGTCWITNQGVHHKWGLGVHAL